MIYYIASTSHPTTPGNDTTGTGTSLLPWATISKAHTSAASGDTVIVKVGGTVVFANQTFTKSLTIQGESAPVYNSITKAWTGPILDGASGNVQWSGGGTTTITLIFQDLVIRNVSSTTAAPLIGNFHNLTLNRIVFYNIGISTTTDATVGGLVGWYTAAAVQNITNCVVYGTTVTGSFGRALFAGFTNATVTLTGNVVYGWGGSVSTATSLIRQFSVPSSNVAVIVAKNNIWVNPGATLPFVTVAAGSITWTYNNNCTFGTWTAIPSGSNNITTDPLLVDAANGDFRLRPSSPAVNTGVAL